MYKIVCVSSRIVVATFNDLAQAKHWCELNNMIDDEPVKLFEIVRADKLGTQK